jgi:hypothetical protein
MDIVRDDTAFRTTVLVELKYISKDLEELKVGLKDHVEDDKRNFGKVDQRIGTSESWINKGLGMAALLIVMIGVIMYIIDKAQP